MIKVNEEKCIGCGACVKECVGAFISLDNKKAVFNGQKCIGCGHCLAVCPTNAILFTNNEYDNSGIEELSESYGKIDSDLLLKAIKSRRSIRQYLKKPVEKAKLEKILEAGRYTATAVNFQSHHFVVVQEKMAEFKKLAWEAFHLYLNTLSKEEINSFAILSKAVKYDGTDETLDTLFWNAPCLIVVASDKPGRPWDAGMATQVMELVGNSLGLGALFTGFMVRVIKGSEKLQKWLGIENLDLMTCMLLGYPAVNYKRTVPRKKLKIQWK